MKNPIFDVKQEMMAEFNAIASTGDYSFMELFPLRATLRFDIHAFNADEEYPVVADVVAFDTKAPLKSRNKVGSWDGNLQKIAISRAKDERKINEMKDIKSIAIASDSRVAFDQIDKMIYDDVDFCVKGVSSKVELDALRIASSGVLDKTVKLDGKGKGTADVINFNVPKDNFGGVDTAWTNASTADGIADIVKYQEAIEDKGKATPMYCFMDKKLFKLLIAQDATKKRCSSFILNATNLESYNVLTVDAVNSYMSANGYPEIVVIDRRVQVEGADGKKETVRPFNPNVFTLAPNKVLGATFYKEVPMLENSDSEQTYGSFFKTTRYYEENPMSEVTMSEAYVIPVLLNRDSTCFVNAKKNTWNNGAE